MFRIFLPTFEMNFGLPLIYVSHINLPQDQIRPNGTKIDGF